MDGQRIRITSEELNSTENIEAVRRLDAAQRISMVRNIGDQSQAQGSSFNVISVLILTGSGLLGGILAFLLNRVGDATFLANASVTASNLFFSFSLAFLIGVTVAMSDAITSMIGSKIAIAAAISIPLSLFLGLIFGWIASEFYTWRIEIIFQNILTEDDFADITRQLHIPRGIAWLIVGLAAGLVVGIASRSIKRTLITAAGGAVGGFLGGFIFDFITLGEWVSQIVGIGITGLLIGASMSLLEQAARTHWIEIVEGGMAGKQFILYKNEITIGSSSDSDITLIKDSAIVPRHARIRIQGSRSIVESLNPGTPILVNGVVNVSAPLVDGTLITLGQTQIRFRERKSQAVPSAGVHTS